MRERDIPLYLLRRGLLDAESVVSGNLHIVDVSRRNANFRVTRDAAESFLLKKGVSHGGFTSTSREAAAYRLLWSTAFSNGIKRLVPRLVAFDEDEDVLVLELFPEARDLRQHHRRTGRYSRRIAAMVGAGLAALHGPPLPEGFVPEHGLIAPEPPGLYLHRPGLHVLHELSAACLELIHVVQSAPEVGETLDLLRKEWRPCAFIHSDVRWDNVLLVSTPSRSLRIKIVDWEAAGIGDPAWDLGSILGDYLGGWISSIPIDAQAEPATHIELAGCPLDTVQPALRACWDAYVGSARLGAVDAGDLLNRVAQFAGLKLMQNALEHLDQAPACTPTAIVMVQTGLNIVLRPREALTTVFGIPLPERA